MSAHRQEIYERIKAGKSLRGASDGIARALEGLAVGDLAFGSAGD